MSCCSSKFDDLVAMAVGLAGFSALTVGFIGALGLALWIAGIH